MQSLFHAIKLHMLNCKPGIDAFSALPSVAPATSRNKKAGRLLQAQHAGEIFSDR